MGEILVPTLAYITTPCHMKDKFYVVAIGTSSGGLPVLIDILKLLPNYNNAAFIIIQHLHIEHRSVADEILATHTLMPVYRAHENQLVEVNSVYVLPENHMMTIKDGRLKLVERTYAHRINHAVDIFFKSMGEELKERAIGVVLTGRGDDGTDGSSYIHTHGGIVMVQRPSTAEYKGMPQSMVLNGYPNFVLSIEELVNTLIEFFKRRDL
jgi:two-component system CheB/CheR fusion protein